MKVKSERKSPPTHFQIFDHWKDIQVDGMYIVNDYGEPSCWCCEKPIIIDNEEELQKKSDYKGIWNSVKGKLEKCHIVAKSLGGSYEVENMFLMCPQCHFNSPDTSNRSLFFKWVVTERQRCIMGLNIQEKIDDIEDLCQRFDISSSDFFGHVIENGWETKTKYTSHGSSISPSSLIVSVISDIIDMNKQSKAS